VVAVGVIAFVCAVLGDNIGFLIGHFGGRRLALKYGRYVFLTSARLDKAEEFFEHHGGKIIVAARFIEGLRQANGIVAGITGMHWKRFIPFNALGAALWVGVWVSLGYLAGNHITTLYNQITRYSLYVLIVLAVAVAALVGWRVRKHLQKRRGRAEAAGAQPAPEPEAQVQPAPEAAVQAEPEAHAEPEPTPVPGGQPEPEPGAQSEPEPGAQPEPEPGAQSGPETEVQAKPGAQPGARASNPDKS
jgi:membrane protein DedA with SNARE-associated domain